VRWKCERHRRIRGIESNTFASETCKRGSRGAHTIGAKGVEGDEENVGTRLRFPASRQKDDPEEASDTAEDHRAILHDRRW
jgi:hypothetical protein